VTDKKRKAAADLNHAIHDAIVPADPKPTTESERRVELEVARTLLDLAVARATAALAALQKAHDYADETRVELAAAAVRLRAAHAALADAPIGFVDLGPAPTPADVERARKRRP
jgi:hypothetical protein